VTHPSKLSKPNHPFLCIGHRGASGHEPENTLRSIRRALELGVDGIEIDVRLVEGELLVFHDARLERTTNGRGSLARKTLAQARALDAGQGEQIPTLREVCELTAQRVFINVELKGPGTAGPTARLIRELVEHHGWSRDRFLISSFLRRELRAFRKADAGATPMGLLLTRPTRFSFRSARAFGCLAVHPPLKYTDRAFVEKAHERGLKVYVYTVNEPKEIAAMRAIGVDGVFTDFPDRVRGAVD